MCVRTAPGVHAYNVLAGLTLCFRVGCVRAGEFEFDFEEAQLTEQTVRELVWEEMSHYHK